MQLNFKKGHKKAYLISILNLYSLALLWLVSGAISASYHFNSLSELIYFSIGAIACMLLGLFFQNRNPLNLYIEIRSVILSKILITIVTLFIIIFFAGTRSNDGIDYIELSSLIFAYISMLFMLTFLFKTSHSEKWYDEKIDSDESHLAD